MTSKLMNRIAAGILSVASLGSVATVPTMAATHSKSTPKKASTKKTSTKKIRIEDWDVYYGNPPKAAVYVTYTDGTPSRHVAQKGGKNYKTIKSMAENLYDAAAKNSAYPALAKKAQSLAKKTNGKIAVLVHKAGVYTIANYTVDNNVKMQVVVNEQGRVSVYHQVKNDPKGMYLQYQWPKK